MTPRLAFERKRVSRSSGDRSFVEFLINGKPLSELIGDLGDNIGKFGWGDSINAPYRNDYELQELNELKYLDQSSLENGLFSLFVCAECGDEGCGAVMFRKQTTEDNIVWSDFMWSNGYDEVDDTHEKIDVEPIVFDKQEYKKALRELEALLKKH